MAGRGDAARYERRPPPGLLPCLLFKQFHNPLGKCVPSPEHRPIPSFCRSPKTESTRRERSERLNLVSYTNNGPIS